jgi:4-hydroxy-tetrahydrodipicolinate synthase
MTPTAFGNGDGPTRPTGAQVLLLTPFTDDGDVDERSLASLVDYVIDGGVDGIIGLGTTGEFFTMSVDEQAQLMTTLAKVVAGRLPITFGVGNSATSVSIALAKHAQALGGEGVMLQPPYYFDHTAASVEAHFAAVAGAIDLPVMPYDGGGGIELSVERVRRLHEQSANVRYVKMSIVDPAKVAAMREGAPGVEVLVGDENMLLMGLRHGAIGSSVGWSNVDPGAISRVHRAFEGGDLEGARTVLLREVVPAVSPCITAKNGWIRSYKEILFAKGVIASPATRLPLTPLDPIRREEVLAAMRELAIVP